MEELKQHTMKARLHSWLSRILHIFNPRSLRGGIAIFGLVFAVIGGGYLLVRSFAIDAPLYQPDTTYHHSFHSVYPKTKSSVAPSASTFGCADIETCYYWDGGAQRGINAAGASITMSQEAPALGSDDYHTLAQLWLSTADEQQSVEFGWKVGDGNNKTHLFVSYWVNGNFYGDNCCGFVPTSSVTAGSNIQTGVNGDYKVIHANNQWQFYYNGTEIGYLPDSLWHGIFTSASVVQVWGEVAASGSHRPTSQMGNGILGSKSGAASFSNYSLYGSSDAPNLGSFAAWEGNVSDTDIDTFYSYGNASSTGLSYGGPGSYGWFINGQPPMFYGNGYDKPVPADYNGDKKTDIAVFRPADKTWYIKGQTHVVYGLASDTPVPADYNGDRKTDIAIFRPSNGAWYIKGQTHLTYGIAGDVPLPADYTGDRRADIAVFRPSNNTWYIRGQTPVAYGAAGDIPVPADYNGDGKTDIAIFRPSNGAWYIRGQTHLIYGINGDTPVPADYNGDKKADIAVFRPSNQSWYINGRAHLIYGNAGDIPMPADYLGTGKSQIAVWRPF